MLTDHRLRSEADFPPLHSGSDGPFGDIVGRFDALMFEEGKKVVPVVEQAFCPGPDPGVGTVTKNDAIVTHPVPHGLGVAPQLVTIAAGFFEGMPAGENRSDRRQHILGEAVGMVGA